MSSVSEIRIFHWSGNHSCFRLWFSYRPKRGSAFWIGHCTTLKSSIVFQLWHCFLVQDAVFAFSSVSLPVKWQCNVKHTEGKCSKRAEYITNSNKTNTATSNMSITFSDCTVLTSACWKFPLKKYRKLRQSQIHMAWKKENGPWKNPIILVISAIQQDSSQPIPSNGGCASTEALRFTTHRSKRHRRLKSRQTGQASLLIWLLW